MNDFQTGMTVVDPYLVSKVKEMRIVPSSRSARLGALALLMMIGNWCLIGQSTSQPAAKAVGQKAGQTGAPAAANPPEAVAASMWGKMITKCPVPGSATTSAFLSYPRRKGDSPYGGLVEIREPWTRLLPEELSAADRLNGVQFRGFALLGGTAMRSVARYDSSRVWSQWTDISEFKRQTWTAKDYRNATEVRWGGVFIIIEQRDHQWHFSMLDPSPFLQDSYSFDPDSGEADRRSCAVLTSANPLAK